MLTACPECGENELSWDGYDHLQGDEGGQCICQNCGTVVAVNNLMNEDPRHANIPSHSGQPSTAQERRAYAIRSQGSNVRKGLRLGVKCTQRVGQCLECGPAMIAEAVALFERFYNNELFRRRSTSVKQTLAGCCVYIVCRRHSWPITMASVAAFTGGNAYELQSLKNELLANFDDLSDVRPPDLSELVEAQCARCDFSDQIRETLMKIIELCRDTWITEGRRPETVIAAASYVTWQSDDPKGRGKTSVKSFCSAHRMLFSSRASDVAKEIKSTLCQLAERIPWIVAGSVNNKNIIWHISDVLKYRCTLEADARSLFPQDNELHVDNSDNTAVSDSQAVEAGSYCSGPTCQAECVTETCFREDSKPVLSLDKRTPLASRKRAELSVVKDEPFLPASYKAPKRQRKQSNSEPEESSHTNHPDLDAPELSSHDIPDEQMHIYVKSAT